MFLIRQRYKFETNSQLEREKDNRRFIVSDTSKIQIWNQFTTNWWYYLFKNNCFWYVKDTNLKPIHNLLQLLTLRNRIVSDTSKIQIWNQFTTLCSWHCFCCKLFLIRQRYKFETNSQPYAWGNVSRCIVSDTSKIQIWNQFTTPRAVPFRAIYCFWYVKDTNLKPIHNRDNPPILFYQLFLIRQRYKFETNSQPAGENKKYSVDCFWYVKDTNLKPIHNI